VKHIFAVAVVFGLGIPSLALAQSGPALSGRYRFVLTVGPTCPASMQVGPLSIVVEVAETTVNSGIEVSGRSASAFEVPDNGRFALLRQGARLHGAFGASTLELGLDTEGQYRVWMQIMTDGSVATASGGRARAMGAAFGEVELSLAADPTGKPIGNCQLFTAGYQWALEPV
jgi:hypothetical protein